MGSDLALYRSVWWPWWVMMSLMNCAILAVWPSFVPYTIRYFDMFDRFC